MDGIGGIDGIGHRVAEDGIVGIDGRGHEAHRWQRT